MSSRRLLIALLALTLCGSALAEGNRTLTCSATNVVGGCMLEVPVIVLGSLEVAVGLDAQAAFIPARASFLAPYALVGWYASGWSAWVELRLPASRVPFFGTPEPFRVGFTVRF